VRTIIVFISLLFPWSRPQPLKSNDTTWEEFYRQYSPSLIPRLQGYIRNIDLLHKPKEEDQLNRLQLPAQEAEPDTDCDFFTNSDDIANRIDTDLNDGPWEDIPLSSVIDEVIGTLTELDSDFYIHEGVDAAETQGYLTTSPGAAAQNGTSTVKYSLLSEKYVMDSLKSMSTAASAIQSDSINVLSPPLTRPDVQPSVFITDGTEDDEAINRIVIRFNLNIEQANAFRIIADHFLGKSKFGEQLLMGLFGEAETGKSRVIDAIRAWFASQNRSRELVVTATTGTAAFNIRLA
jgi:hypothetical protein